MRLKLFGIGIVMAHSCAAMLAGFASISDANAQSYDDRTMLIDINYGTSLSRSIREYSDDGFELSDGTPVIFGDWYDAEWRDFHITFMTPLRRNTALIWGFGTGESGGQYEIDPSFRVGMAHIFNLTDLSVLRFSGSMVVGGYLTEKPCTADYGAIGGVQSVNCRLAASAMRPSDTLDYLIRQRPEDQIRISLMYEFEF